MTVNVYKLRGKIKEAGITQEKFAARILMDKSTFSRKMKSDGLSFTVKEVHLISETLKLSKDEAADIFLSQNSRLCEF